MTDLTAEELKKMRDLLDAQDVPNKGRRVRYAENGILYETDIDTGDTWVMEFPAPSAK